LEHTLGPDGCEAAGVAVTHFGPFLDEDDADGSLILRPGHQVVVEGEVAVLEEA